MKALEEFFCIGLDSCFQTYVIITVLRKFCHRVVGTTRLARTVTHSTTYEIIFCLMMNDELHGGLLYSMYIRGFTKFGIKVA